MTNWLPEKRIRIASTVLFRFPWSNYYWDEKSKIFFLGMDLITTADFILCWTIHFLGQNIWWFLKKSTNNVVLAWWAIYIARYVYIGIYYYSYINIIYMHKIDRYIFYVFIIFFFFGNKFFIDLQAYHAWHAILY